MVIYWLVRLAFALTARIPPSWGYSVAAALCTLVYYVWSEKRASTIANMAHVCGQPPTSTEARRLARRSWASYGRYVFEFLRFPAWDADELRRQIAMIPEWQQVGDQALAQGKGGLILTAHFGNWDVAGTLGSGKFPMSAVVDNFEPAALNRLIQGQREEKGLEIIPLERTARKIVRALNANKLVAIVFDRPLDPGPGAVAVRFFGEIAYVSSGPASLALKTGAALLPGFVWRRSTGAFEGRFWRIPAATSHSSFAANVQETTQRIYGALEEMIRLYPEQWYMFRTFWLADRQQAWRVPTREGADILS